MRPLSFSLVCLCASWLSLHAGSYLDEDFSSYAKGKALPEPWLVNYSGNPQGGSTVLVYDTLKLSGFEPAGKQVELNRPFVSDGVPSVSIETGALKGTSPWNLEDGTAVTLKVDFSFTNLSNGHSFQFVLKGGNITCFGVRVNGIGDRIGGLQYMTTNAAASFTDVPGEGPLLMDSVWYRLTATIRVEGAFTTVSSIQLERLGKKIETVYTTQDLKLDSPSFFGLDTSFVASISAGTVDFQFAGLELEPAR